MVLTFAKVPFESAVFAGTTLEVLQLEEKYGWTINAHQQQTSSQNGYWCSVNGLSLGATERGTTVLGRGETLAEALQDLARQLSGQQVTVYANLETITHHLPQLTHSLPLSL